VLSAITPSLSRPSRLWTSKNFAGDVEKPLPRCAIRPGTERFPSRPHIIAPTTLSLLDQVDLSVHCGFRGKLQSDGSTGRTAPYYATSAIEVVFHVATRFPSTDDGARNKKVSHVIQLDSLLVLSTSPERNIAYWFAPGRCSGNRIAPLSNCASIVVRHKPNDTPVLISSRCLESTR